MISDLRASGLSSVVQSTYTDGQIRDRMYQRKIAQWELEKKHKAPEMRAVIRLARQREAAGQRSIFRIRGRKTDIDEVYRYFKRRGEDPSRLDVRDSPIPSTITVETPPPPPPPTQHKQFENVDDDDPVEVLFFMAPDYPMITYPNSETGHLSTSATGSSSGSSTRSDSDVSTPLVFSDGSRAWQLIPDDPHLGMPIDITFADQCSRFLLQRTQLFFDHIVLQEFYSRDTANTVISKPWRRTMSSWSRATSEGNELMQRGQADDTLGELRSKAHDSVKKHIRSRSPIILLRYFEIICGLRNSGDQRDQLYLDRTLKFVLQMAEIVLPQWHPIRQLTWLFLHPQVNPIIGPLAQQGIQKSLEILFEKCGPRHPRILYVHDSRTQTLLDEHHYEEATRQANLYLNRAEFIRGDSSYEACQAWRMLGDAYAAQSRLDQARKAYTAALNHQSPRLSLKDRGIITVKTKRGLAGIAKTQALFPEAHEHLQAALQMARESFGEADVQAKLVEKDLRALYDEVRQVTAGLAYRPSDTSLVSIQHVEAWPSLP